VGAAERARGALVPEPGLEAGAVEEVAAGEPVHHGLRLEPGQAHAAVVVARGRLRRAARRTNWIHIRKTCCCTPCTKLLHTSTAVCFALYIFKP
jgi:hypothetical protein